MDAELNWAALAARVLRDGQELAATEDVEVPPLPVGAGDELRFKLASLGAVEVRLVA